MVCRKFGDSVRNLDGLNIGEFLIWRLCMAGHYVHSCNLNNGGFYFGNLVLDCKIAKFNVSPIFLRLWYYLLDLFFVLINNFHVNDVYKKKADCCMESALSLSSCHLFKWGRGFKPTLGILLTSY